MIDYELKDRIADYKAILKRKMMIFEYMCRADIKNEHVEKFKTQNPEGYAKLLRSRIKKSNYNQ